MVVERFLHVPVTLALRGTGTTKMPPVTTILSINNTYTVLERGHYIMPAGDVNVAIVTAVIRRDFPAKGGFNVFLNGWAKHNTPKDFKCCFLTQANATNVNLIETTADTYHVYNQWIVDMQNAEFSCSISRKQLTDLSIKNNNNNTIKGGETGTGTKTGTGTETTPPPIRFMTFAQHRCEDAPREVLEIEAIKRTPSSVGLCLKISYGHIDPETVVEWFEYQKIVGVTKVFSFLAEDLHPDVRKVFEYYVSTGFLETNPIYPAPSKNGTHRGFRRPRWEQQAWVDEVMAINDCKHRMSGLDFVIVHDMDELIVPTLPEDNIYTILKKTLQAVPLAGAFSFDSHVTMLEWGPTRASPSHIMRTTNRTKFVNYDGASMNTRWAFVSDRIFYGQNNKAWPRGHYTSTRVNNNLYKLFHRRQCKVTWKGCLREDIRQRDDTIVRYEAQLLSNMRQIPLASLLGNASTGYIQGIASGVA